MAKKVTSETMKCPVCGKGEWKVKSSLSGIGIAVILLGWVLAVPTCSFLESAGVGPGFFGMSGGGIIAFFVIIVIAHFAARSYKRRRYECSGCGHITSA